MSQKKVVKDHLHLAHRYELPLHFVHLGPSPLDWLVENSSIYAEMLLNHFVEEGRLQEGSASRSTW